MRFKMLRRAGLAAALLLLATPAAWADTVQGEVIQVQERVRTQNGGEEHQLTIRTREGEEFRLHLGAAGACQGCVQVGDQVRVRTTTRASEGQGQQVRQMAVDRTGNSYTFRNRSGQPIPTQVHSRGGSAGVGAGSGAGDMDRDRDRDRIHAPGTGGGTGAGGGNRHGGGHH